MRKILETIKYYSDKHYSTIAGTLVYFLLMSIAPFLLWLTLVGANTHIDRFFSHELFSGILPILRYLKSSAESAVGGAGIVFLITSLYSSTNFFYHLRRSGEIVYGSKKTKGGIKLRIASTVFIFLAIVLFAVLALVAFAGSWVLERILHPMLAEAISSVFLTLISFVVAMVLNVIACPYKVKSSEIVTGSLLTTALWIVFAAGFSIYLTFATPERLYGKLAFLIIFLLWCYLMMTSFVIGVILNGSFMKKREYKIVM